MLAQAMTPFWRCPACFILAFRGLVGDTGPALAPGTPRLGEGYIGPVGGGLGGEGGGGLIGRDGCRASTLDINTACAAESGWGARSSVTYAARSTMSFRREAFSSRIFLNNSRIVGAADGPRPGKPELLLSS